MKYLLVVVVISLAGCQSAPVPSVLPPPAKSMPAVTPPPAAPTSPPASAVAGLEQKIRQQAQYIEALISQNDALTAKLSGANSVPPPTPATAPLPSAPSPVQPPTTPTSPPEPTLTPNADNVIDLVAVVVADKPGEPVNPFVVRAVPADAMREVTLQVGGIVAGPMACAVINERLVQVGEFVESLAVERIEPDAVLFRHSGRLLRLPVAEKPIRVRLPL